MTCAVIVGAGGIATATACLLAHDGFTEIHVLSRGESNSGTLLRQALGDLEVEVDVELRQCDVTDWASVTKACEGISGPVHAVVYTAGARSTAVPSKLEQAEWRTMLDVYAGGLVDVLIPLEDKLADGASVVALSGTSGRRVVSPGHLAMGSGKAALDHSIAYLANWLAPRGVRVNGVCCGPVDTPTVRSLLMPAEMETLQQDLQTRTLAGRLATAEDVASVVTMLCDPRSRWIYGQVILADGGEGIL